MNQKTKNHRSRSRGQAITEFGLALPILMLVVVGLFEVGRAVFMHSSVTNASREAVRYATAFGVNESNVLHYQNCAAIRDTARKVGFLLPLEDDDIVIEYDTGPDPDTGVVPSPFDSCDAVAGDATDGVDDSIGLSCGDRVVVTVTSQYNPILPKLIPLSAQTISSSSARTFVGVVELSEDAEECN